MSSTLSRLTKLEAENVALQEEILFLKKQLTNVSLSPQHPRAIVHMEETIRELRYQVERAVAELKKYRKGHLDHEDDLNNLLH